MTITNKEKTKSPIEYKHTHKNGLLGLYFLSFNKTGEEKELQWQGHIQGRPEPGWYMVQLYSWVHGMPTETMLVRIEDMIDWWFYDDIEYWRQRGEDVRSW